MVTHSMQHAVSVEDTLVVMYRGRIVYNVGGSEKWRFHADELGQFEELRRAELLDASAAEMLRAAYV